MQNIVQLGKGNGSKKEREERNFTVTNSNRFHTYKFHPYRFQTSILQSSSPSAFRNGKKTQNKVYFKINICYSATVGSHKL